MGTQEKAKLKEEDNKASNEVCAQRDNKEEEHKKETIVETDIDC